MNKSYYLIDPPEGWKYEFPKSIMKDDYDKTTNLKDWCVENGYPKSLADSYKNHFYIGVSGPIPCVEIVEGNSSIM